MASSRTTLNVCEACHNIDFAYLLKHPIRNEYNIGEAPGILTVLSKDCDLCATWPDVQHGEEVELRTVLHSDYLWSPRTYQEHDALSNVRLGISKRKRRGQWEDVPMNSASSNWVFCTPRHDTEQHLSWKLHPLSNSPDYNAARAWLSCCKNRHGTTCDSSPPPYIEGMLLVDIHESRIVKVDSILAPRWLALSCRY
jgi:hypothetical protein